MAAAIRFLLQNFSVVVLLSGFALALVSVWRRQARSRAQIVEALLAYFVLCSVALNYFYNFAIHVFFGDMAARFIGWADSPFQREVGFASLGFAVVGLLAFRGDFSLRLAAIVGPACFTLGAAATHVLAIIRTDNLAPGNAGAVLYTDVLMPLIGFVLLGLWRRYAIAKA